MMTKQEIKETLEKQLQLLSERSVLTTTDEDDLVLLSEAMLKISVVLLAQ